MENSAAINETQVLSFMEGLRTGLPDLRDNRGKRHSQEFTLVAVAIAMMAQCRTLSSIHRFIDLRLEWLQALTGMLAARALSRAYLPRFLDRIDGAVLGQMAQAHFSTPSFDDAWVALDGKVLRGSSRAEQREAVVLAVAHGTGQELARAPQSGAKSSEVRVVRELLEASALAGRRVSFDALHCNPETLSLVAQARGVYLVQVKGNQPELLEQCCRLAAQEPPLAQSSQCDKGHGRVTARTCHLLPLRSGALDGRWAPCEVRYLVTVLRQVYTCTTQTTSTEQSYYITNAAPGVSAPCLLAGLASAIRQHWSVESNNWVRDVTLGEDSVRVLATNQAHILALLRSVALNLLRRAGGPSVQAQIERFCHVPSLLASWLKQMRVL